MQARIETITPEKASGYLKKNKNNRAVSAPLVSRMAREMREGLWAENGETIVFNGDGRLLDGQHRLMAVVESGETIRSLVVTRVPATAFQTIDTGKVSHAG